MNLTPQTLQLVSLLVAPAAALCGVWLGPRLTSRIQQDRWLLEQRTASYLGAIRTAHTIIMSSVREFFVDVAFRRQRDSIPEYKEVRSEEIAPEEFETFVKGKAADVIDQSLAPLVAAYSEVALYGSTAAYQAYSKVVDAINDNLKDEALFALAQFITTCRKELKLPDLPDLSRLTLRRTP